VADGAPLAMRALLEVLPPIDHMPIKEAFAKTKRGCTSLTAYERMLHSEDFL
jgi:hypothetical protein